MGDEDGTSARSVKTSVVDQRLEETAASFFTSPRIGAFVVLS